MSTIEKIDSNRKKYWFSAMVRFALSRIRRDRREPNNWIFGAWHGGKYDDNSRYLFEYVNSHCPSIKTTWLSNDARVVKEVRELGFHAEIADSPEGRKAQRDAGFAFYTNGIDDFSYRPAMLGAQIVALWHGAIGQKNTWHMNDHSTGIKRKLKAVKSHMFEWVYRDFTCAVSDYCAELKERAFLIRPGTIHVTGQPRNDELLRRSRAAIDESACTILYMPTHGPERARHIEETIRLLCAEDFSAVLRAHDARVVVKLHYLTEIENGIGSPYVEVIKGDTDKSSQDLLAEASILVTDYSSCAIDYAILDRPIVLYTPDMAEYTENQDIGEDWQRLYSTYGIANSDDFLRALKSQLAEQTRDLRVTQWINDRYLDRGTLQADSSSPFCVSTLRALIDQYPDLRRYIGMAGVAEHADSPVQ